MHHTHKHLNNKKIDLFTKIIIHVNAIIQLCMMTISITKKLIIKKKFKNSLVEKVLIVVHFHFLNE